MYHIKKIGSKYLVVDKWNMNIAVSSNLTKLEKFIEILTRLTRNNKDGLIDSRLICAVYDKYVGDETGEIATRELSNGVLEKVQIPDKKRKFCHCYLLGIKNKKFGCKINICPTKYLEN